MIFKRFLLIFFLPLTILLIHTQFLILNQDFYEDEFFKHDIYKNFNQPKEKLDSEVSEIVGFLKGKNELSSDFLQEKEKQHLQDVKNLMQKYRIATYILILLTLCLFIWNWHNKKSILFICLGTVILLLLSVFLLQYIFADIFTSFHEVSFDNDLWLLNPETDNLINVFPQGFFYDIVSEIFKRSLITAVVLFMLMSGYYWFFCRDKQKIYKNQESI